MTDNVLYGIDFSAKRDSRERAYLEEVWAHQFKGPCAERGCDWKESLGCSTNGCMLHRTVKTQLSDPA